MKDKILVVGGYGKVGQTICHDLAEALPGKIIAAGRSFDKAQQLSIKSQGKILPRQFDLWDESRWDEGLAEIILVVMCLDQKDTGFVEACMKKHIHYMDISASYRFLLPIESLDSTAKIAETTVVLGVGLCPGLTNLLVKYSRKYFDSITAAEIYIMLGLGDKHGKAAIEWTIDNLSASFSIWDNEAVKTVKGFEDGKKTLFPGRWGRRTAYRFDFVDQHVIPRTLGIKSVSTRLCFDSAFLSSVFAAFKRIGLFSFLKFNKVRNFMVSLFEKFHWGSDIFVLKVDTKGTKEGAAVDHQSFIKGNGESRATGKVAAIVAESLYQKTYPAGVHYLEQLFEPEEIFDRLGSGMETSL